jgi:hypothetical protein
MKIIYEEKAERGKLQIIETKTRFAGIQYYWRTVAKNGRIIAKSSESFKKLQGCLKDLRCEKLLMSQTSCADNIAYELNVKI